MILEEVKPYRSEIKQPIFSFDDEKEFTFLKAYKCWKLSFIKKYPDHKYLIFVLFYVS